VGVINLIILREEERQKEKKTGNQKRKRQPWHFFVYVSGGGKGKKVNFGRGKERGEKGEKRLRIQKKEQGLHQPSQERRRGPSEGRGERNGSSEGGEEDHFKEGRLQTSQLDKGRRERETIINPHQEGEREKVKVPREEGPAVLSILFPQGEREGLKRANQIRKKRQEKKY